MENSLKEIGSNKTIDVFENIKITPSMIEAAAQALEGELSYDWEGASSFSQRLEIVKNVLVAIGIRESIIDQVTNEILTR